jgi:putative endonuclease
VLKRLLARWRGRAAEDAALVELRQAGLRLVSRNFLVRGGEIDLVMCDGAVLVFVEVRYRAVASFGDGIASIDAAKRQRLIKAASHFVQRHPAWRLSPQRFDAISLGAGGTRWVKNVFVVDA